jgi:hypothetical protein
MLITTFASALGLGAANFGFFAVRGGETFFVTAPVYLPRNPEIKRSLAPSSKPITFNLSNKPS